MVNFLENHDIDRWASVVNDKRLLKIGALLNLFLPGTPSIFYGQEWDLQEKNMNGDMMSITFHSGSIPMDVK